MQSLPMNKYLLCATVKCWVSIAVLPAVFPKCRPVPGINMESAPST
nr:Hypothetical protein [Pseudomonas aeruginosa]